MEELFPRANVYPQARAIAGLDSVTKTIREADVHHHDNHSGLVVFTRPDMEFRSSPLIFLNGSAGADMNQAATYGGTPEIIHNGGTSVEWTAAVVSGSWNFADVGKISITSANNNDAATFSEETPTTIDITNYVALTGKVDLDAFNSANHTIQIAFDLAGTQVGNTLNIDDYIDTANFAEQSFAIPFDDFAFGGDNIDGFTITILRSGGSKPTIKFDDIQLENTGGSFDFRITKNQGYDYWARQIRFSFADNFSTALTDASAVNLGYDKFVNLNALTNGMVFRWVENDEVRFSTTLRQNSDFLRFGNIGQVMSDGTNTFLTIDVDFVDPIIIRNNPEKNYLSLTVNDDLSSLLLFQTVIRGSDRIL